MSVTILEGDCVEVMRGLDSASIDAIVTDPPYGLEFMGKEWDKLGATTEYPADGGGPWGRTARVRYGKSAASMQVWHEQWAREAWRVLKPGGHLLAFGGTRTYHRMACAIEDAGFEIRDCLQWLYGSGFPKSHNLTGEHAGKGTALKPANEPIVLARKPLAEKTVAANVLAWGTGALNIDAGRIVRDLSDVSGWSKTGSHESENRAMSGKNYERDPKPDNDSGRWPANVLLDESAAELLDAQSGERKAGGRVTGKQASQVGQNGVYGTYGRVENRPYNDTGGASRFFYVAKASRKERGRGNNHPTVKPIALMRYLIRLVTPPGGTVLDPFAGSGTTGLAALSEGFAAVLIEREPEYAAIARARVLAHS